MPWCPKCRSEYEQGIKICKDCEIELVEQLDEVTVEESQDYDKEAYLTTAANSIEAGMIEGLLESNGIPMLKKFRGVDGYLDIYMGSTNFGVDIYVPSKSLENAKDIIEIKTELVEEDPQASAEEYAVDSNEKYKKNQRILTWLVLVVLIPGILWIAIAALYNLYHWIMG
ncbi:MAG TPA: DUF2007 domain-containing protein [Ruminiclostridium sp.]